MLRWLEFLARLLFESSNECFEWSLTFLFLGFCKRWFSINLKSWIFTKREKGFEEDPPHNIFHFHELYFTCFPAIHNQILRTLFTFIPCSLSLSLSLNGSTFIPLRPCKYPNYLIYKRWWWHHTIMINGYVIVAITRMITLARILQFANLVRL